MTEEINNLNTDLKELFVESKIDEIKQLLNKESHEVIREITLYNYEIIRNYYESGKYDILIQHIKFVAYTSFLCEYSAEHLIIEGYDEMSELFHNILLLLKKD